MTICSRFGPPHLFITGTTNPKWPEIQDQLHHDQTVHDRPSIANRVFNLKLKFIISLIENGLFGNFIARVDSKEWQKRGLTHFHLIVWLDLPSNFEITPQFIDNILSAELPPEDSALFEIIKRCNLHGPCGEDNPSSPCMVNGVCSKGFKKPFSKTTKVQGLATRGWVDSPPGEPTQLCRPLTRRGRRRIAVAVHAQDP